MSLSGPPSPEDTSGISPLLEFDPSPQAVIEPAQAVSPFSVPEAFVICFFRDAIERLRDEMGAPEIGHLESEMGRHPVIEVEWTGKRVGIALGGVGAPLAAAWLDELIAMGARRFVVAGGAGGLVPSLTLGHVVVPVAALRDEGTSYHYAPPSRVIEPATDAVEAITRTLERNDVPFLTGMTWTTDAFYRETRGKVERRVAEGCLTVEMEAAALFAVARFRGASLGEMLYAGDDLSGDVWAPRGWQRHASGRDLLLHLAVEAVTAIGDAPSR
ncbi:MAG: nucleoside phosphorylase [Chloroflexota bacterium]